MASLKELELMKRRVEDLRAEIDRARGARDEALRVLREDFEVDSLEEARDLLSELTAEEEAARAAFDSAMEEYEERWGGELES